jgi:group I intron endonuclease
MATEKPFNHSWLNNFKKVTKYSFNNLEDVPNSAGIYCILNTQTDRFYVGETKYLQTRAKQHLNALNSRKMKNKELQSDWLTYKAEDFIFYVLENTDDCSKADYRKQREVSIIGAYSNIVYNTARNPAVAKPSAPNPADNKPKQVEINGITYPSITKAAVAYQMPRSKMRKLLQDVAYVWPDPVLKDAALDKADVERLSQAELGENLTQLVEVNGVAYASVSEACEKTGLSRVTLWRHAKKCQETGAPAGKEKNFFVQYLNADGSPMTVEAVGKKREQNQNQNISYKGIIYQNAEAAAKATGQSRKTILSHVQNPIYKDCFLVSNPQKSQSQGSLPLNSTKNTINNTGVNLSNLNKININNNLKPALLTAPNVKGFKPADYSKHATKTAGIYCIFNESNGRFYIGESQNLQKRLGILYSALRNNKMPNPELQSDWNKYSQDSFVFYIVDNSSQVDSKSFRKQKETDLIYAYKNTVYNLIKNPAVRKPGPKNPSTKPTAHTINGITYASVNHVALAFGKSRKTIENWLNNTNHVWPEPSLKDAALEAAYAEKFGLKQKKPGFFTKLTQKVYVQGTIYNSLSEACKLVPIAMTTLQRRLNDKNYASEFYYVDANNNKMAKEAILQKRNNIKKGSISVNGVVYTSLTQAAKQLNINKQTLSEWVNNPINRDVFWVNNPSKSSLD